MIKFIKKIWFYDMDELTDRVTVWLIKIFPTFTVGLAVIVAALWILAVILFLIMTKACLTGAGIK